MTPPAFLPRLLVVDGDHEARTFLRRRFTRLGYEVIEAGEHAKALSLAAAMPFDLVLLDLQTPAANGDTGLDLLRRLREARGPGELPILAIAAEGAAEDMVEALDLGADDCVQRPLHVNLAHARAEMLLGGRGEGASAQAFAARHELEARLETLGEAAFRAEAVSAGMEEMGRDARVPLNGLLGAASVILQICQSPQLKPAIEKIETAAAALDMVMVRALGRADRRARAPKSKLRVLLADADGASRRAVRELLNAAEVAIDTVLVDSGEEAALATDSMFFDLIVVDLAMPQALAALRVIRRAERQNMTRRAPVLALAAEGTSAAEALDAGADLLLRAPVSAERLLSALAEAMARESDCVSATA